MRAGAEGVVDAGVSTAAAATSPPPASLAEALSRLRAPYELPATLTPTKMTRFMACPLAFRLAYLDHLPEPPTLDQVRGTLVHRALHLLFSSGPAADRSPERARASIEEAFDEPAGRAGLEPLGLDPTGEARLRREAAGLLDRYFALEDPTSVRPIGLELDVRVRVDQVDLRGIIDRLDRLEDGSVVVVDYKTGRAPRPEQARSRLGGVHFYAFLCEQLLGRRPSEVRLMYLRDQVVVVESPTDQSMRGLRQRAMAVWNAIGRACGSGDFRPNPSPLCRTCAFRSHCPAAPVR